MIKYDIDNWKRYHRLEQKILVKKIIKILEKEMNKNDETIEDFVPNWLVVEALKKSVGLKYEIPEQRSKKFLLEFGYIEKELIPIDKIDWDE